MSITDTIFSKGSRLIKLQPEVTNPKYSMADDGGIECELGEWIYGLVRLLKPEHVLSTGVYTGISDAYIGTALLDNGFGHLTAIEFENFHLQRARELWSLCGLESFITGILISSLEFEPENKYDLIFLDTEPNIRWAELVKFFPYLNEGGFIGIHDVPRNMCQGNINPDHPEIVSWPFGDIPSPMRELLTEGQLIKFHIPNPRGSVWFYKPHKDDYK